MCFAKRPIKWVLSTKKVPKIIHLTLNVYVEILNLWEVHYTWNKSLGAAIIRQTVRFQ